MVTADQFIASGVYKTVLVVGAEKLSSIVNWKDRNTCVLFGDGAGAVILRNREGGRGTLPSISARTARSRASSISWRARAPPSIPSGHRAPSSEMAGKEVYRQAVSAMNRSAEECLEKAGCKPEQVRWFIPHQANSGLSRRSRSAWASRSSISSSTWTATATCRRPCVPVALHETMMAGKLDRGDLVLLVTFGGGVTWGSLILEW